MLRILLINSFDIFKNLFILSIEFGFKEFRLSLIFLSFYFIRFLLIRLRFIYDIIINAFQTFMHNFQIIYIINLIPKLILIVNDFFQ